MKEKLNLRNVVFWGIALSLLVLFFTSFAASASFKGTIEGDHVEMVFSNVIWGCKSYAGTVNGGRFAMALGMPVVNACGLIGVILLLLSSAGIVLVTLLLKDEKIKKILIFVTGGVVVIGGVLLFFVSEASWYCLIQSMIDEGIGSADIATVKAYYAGFKSISGYGIVGGIIAILLGGGVIVTRLFVPEKKLLK